MNGFFSSVLNNLSAGFGTAQLPLESLAAMMLMVTVLAIYEHVIYRLTARKGFYDKDFSISLAIIPYFIGVIIMTLQSNLVITLGTIGALAIIRFRTAVKNPLDMVFLLWAVSIGIVCGSGLYEMAIVASLWTTVVLLVLCRMPAGRAPWLLVVNCEPSCEEEIEKAVRTAGKLCRVKARNLTRNGLEMIMEVRTKKENALLKAVEAIEGVENASLLSHDGEEIA